MKLGSKKVLLGGLAALTALALVPLQSASAAATTYTVEMGVGVPKGFSSRIMAPIPDGGKAPTIVVHKGDTVNFFGGTVLLPVGQGPLDWKSDYMTDVDSPFANFLSDPDADMTEPFPTDAPYKFGPGFLGQPTPPCGADAASQCAYNGHNSDPVTGVLFAGDVSGNDNNFFVRIDANPGETLWAIGEFGGVTIKSVLRIQVVADNVTATTQAEIDAAKAKYGALERDTALALDAKLRKMSTKHKTKSGTTVWDAFAGYDTGTIALLQWYPNRLVIHKGDKVRWHWNQAQVEDHGTAFPLSYAKNLLQNSVIPSCDPDGDNGDGPDTLANFPDDGSPPNCTAGDLEFDIAREFLAKSGDGKFPGGKEASGIRGANVPEIAEGPDTDGSWDLKFTKATNATGYKYICTIHGGFMKGFVVVKP